MTSIEDENSPYEKLADTLNRIPNGFAKTKDDTYLRVLKWIFTPKEAEFACKMKLKSETLKKMSRRLKIPISELKERMNVMKSKGQIYNSSHIKTGSMKFFYSWRDEDKIPLTIKKGHNHFKFDKDTGEYSAVIKQYRSHNFEESVQYPIHYADGSDGPVYWMSITTSLGTDKWFKLGGIAIQML